MRFFHIAPVPLGVGSIIEPGNWGRVMRFNPAASLTVSREAIYEMVRLAAFKDRPSRLNALFVCPTEQSARQYLETHARLGILYEVELLTPTCNMHVARVADVYSPPPNYTPALGDLEAAAHRYWAGVSRDELGVELVCESACRIVRQCVGHPVLAT